jgi:hypothetical protein
VWERQAPLAVGVSRSTERRPTYLQTYIQNNEDGDLSLVLQPITIMQLIFIHPWQFI